MGWKCLFSSSPSNSPFFYHWNHSYFWVFVIFESISMRNIAAWPPYIDLVLVLLMLSINAGILLPWYHFNNKHPKPSHISSFNVSPIFVLYTYFNSQLGCTSLRGISMSSLRCNNLHWEYFYLSMAKCTSASTSFFKRWSLCLVLKYQETDFGYLCLNFTSLKLSRSGNFEWIWNQVGWPLLIGWRSEGGLVILCAFCLRYLSMMTTLWRGPQNWRWCFSFVTFFFRAEQWTSSNVVSSTLKTSRNQWFPNWKASAPHIRTSS